MGTESVAEAPEMPSAEPQVEQQPSPTTTDEPPQRGNDDERQPPDVDTSPDSE